jgi:hypothetical protein
MHLHRQDPVRGRVASSCFRVNALFRVKRTRRSQRSPAETPVPAWGTRSQGLKSVRWWIGCEAETCLPRLAGLGSRRLEAWSRVQSGSEFVYEREEQMCVLACRRSVEDSYDLVVSDLPEPGRRALGWQQPSTRLAADLEDRGVGAERKRLLGSGGATGIDREAWRDSCFERRPVKPSGPEGGPAIGV